MERPTFTRLLYEKPNVQVFAGFLPSTGQPVATKVLKHTQRAQANASLAEARTQFELKHPNVVEVLGCYSEESEGEVRAALVMELMEKSLSQELAERKVANKPWTEEELCCYLRDLASALALAHSRGIAHRDIKPSNIFLSPTTVKLGDFGSAVGSHHPNSLPNIQGTMEYLSPEIRRYMVAKLTSCADHLSFDLFKSDVFSLGVTMLELVTLGYCLPSVDQYPKLLPLLMKMIAELPQDRPSSAEIVARLMPFQCQVCGLGYEDYVWVEQQEAVFLGSEAFPEVCSRGCLAKFRCLHMQLTDCCSLCGASVHSESAVVLKCCHLVCQWSCLSRYVTRCGQAEGSKLRMRCRSCGQPSTYALGANGECRNLLDLLHLCDHCSLRTAESTLACGHSVCSACTVVFLVPLCPLCGRTLIS